MPRDVIDEITAEEQKYFADAEKDEKEETEGEAPPPAEAPSSPPGEVEPPQATEGAPATEAEEAETEEGEEKPRKMVDLGALHESRAETKEARAELAKMRETVARMEGAFTEVMRRLPGESPPPDAQQPTIDPEEDPEGYDRQRAEILDRRLAGIEQFLQQRGQVDEQTAQQQAFVARYQASAQEFAQKQPDFQEAYNYLAQSADRELQERGFTDPAERAQVLRAEEGQVVVRAFQAGVNPAERIYALAKSRGYKPKANSGETVSHETNAPETDEAKLARLAAGQKAATPQGRGSGDTGEVTLERLSTLDGEDFDKAWEQAKKSGKLG